MLQLPATKFPCVSPLSSVIISSMRFFSLPRFLALLLLLGLALQSPARAETPDQIPNPRLTLNSWVYDGANVIDAADEARINELLSRLKKQNGAVMLVVTVRNLGGQDVKSFTNDVFRRLQVGNKELKNGVLVLAAIDDTKWRVEIGYGLEEVLPDGKATAIVRSAIPPAFRRGAYGEGLYAATLGIAQVLEPSIAGAPATAPVAPMNPPLREPTQPEFREFPVQPLPLGGAVFGLLGLLMLLCPFLVFGAFIWMVISLARRPMRCPKDRTAMRQLSDAAEAHSLTEVQKFEQQIGARDYKVWHCPQCRHEEITAHNETFSAYSECPACHHRTARQIRQTLQHATAWGQGVEQINVQCDWPQCRHSSSRAYYTPRLSGRGNDLTTGLLIGTLLGNSHGSSGSWGGGGGWGGSSGGDSGASSGGYDSGASDFGGDSGGGGGDGSW